MSRHKRNLVIPLVAVALAVVAFTGVVLLQARADGYRHADETLANTGVQFAVAQYTLLEVASPTESVTVVAHQMYAAEASVTSSITILRRTWPVPALDSAAVLVSNDFSTVNALAQILFQDPKLLTSAASNLSSLGSVGNSEIEQADAAKAAMLLASRQYEQRASRARTEALVGTGVALALLLVAFLIFYTRWLRLLDATRRDARRDALTGLGNRRALIEALEERVPAASEARPLVLTLYDLDGFKAYNDSFGHLAGDEVLARFSGRLANAVGPNGWAFRMGGDEFCSLVECSPEETTSHIEQACGALTEVTAGIEIGCSAGSVVLPAEAGSVRAALALADERMYADKAARQAETERPAA